MTSNDPKGEVIEPNLHMGHREYSDIRRSWGNYHGPFRTFGIKQHLYIFPLPYNALVRKRSYNDLVWSVKSKFRDKCFVGTKASIISRKCNVDTSKTVAMTQSQMFLEVWSLDLWVTCWPELRWPFAEICFLRSERASKWTTPSPSPGPERIKHRAL